MMETQCKHLHKLTPYIFSTEGTSGHKHGVVISSCTLLYNGTEKGLFIQCKEYLQLITHAHKTPVPCCLQGKVG
jgi:hypothetical protein